VPELEAESFWAEDALKKRKIAILNKHYSTY
jgi:hypothetical protein